MTAPTRPTATSEKRTLVEDGTEIKGTLASRCPIVVHGVVEGEVSGPSIHVAATGTVAGTVKVQDLRSEGEVAGTVEADTVQLSGRVRAGTVIRARSLEVSLARAEGGLEVTFGDCELAVGDEPSKEAAIAAALAAPRVEEAPPAMVAADAKAEAAKPEAAKAEAAKADAKDTREEAAAAPSDGDDESKRTKRDRPGRGTQPQQPV